MGGGSPTDRHGRHTVRTERPRRKGLRVLSTFSGEPGPWLTQAYFGWPAVTGLIVTTLVAVIAKFRTPVTAHIRALGAMLGLTLAALTFAALAVATRCTTSLPTVDQACGQRSSVSSVSGPARSSESLVMLAGVAWADTRIVPTEANG
jgi:hypothetical protein